MQVGPDARLRVEALACRRGARRLFEHIDIQLAAGDALQLTGANGSGKTSLLRILTGLQRPQAGQVCWDGVDIHAEPDAYGCDLLYLGHDSALNPDLSPLENLCFLQGLRQGGGDYEQALKSWGLDAALNRPCGRLSAGQKRRTALSRLDLADARLWLLDEPAAALDSTGRQRLSEALVGHVQQGGLLLFTTHEPLHLPGVNPRTLELPS